MSERGILRLVIEGEDAQLFHDGLAEFIAESKKNPDYRIEDPSGELYWCIGEDDEDDKCGETTCIDCYSSDGRYKGSAVLYWDSYEREEGLLRLTASWLNTVEVINLGFLWIDDPDDWAKDWDNLTFDERVALCEKYDVIYMATRVITVENHE